MQRDESQIDGRLYNQTSSDMFVMCSFFFLTLSYVLMSYLLDPPHPLLFFVPFSFFHYPVSTSLLPLPLHLFSTVSLHAWLAAIIPALSSMIRGRCRNRCITGRYLTTQHFTKPNTLSFFITDSSVGKKKNKQEEGEAKMWSKALSLFGIWETETPGT